MANNGRGGYDWRGGRAAHAGRGGNAGRGGFAGRGGPSGPPHGQGQRGFFAGRAGGTRGGLMSEVESGGSAFGASGQSTQTSNAEPQLDPQLYKAPKEGYIPQPEAYDIGLSPKFRLCLRCCALKVNHPEFSECREPCAFCNSNGHPGQPCQNLWCSEKWWKTRFGRPLPEGFLRRPSEPQRQILARIDPYFANFPEQLLPHTEYMDPSHKRRRENDLVGESADAHARKKRFAEQASAIDEQRKRALPAENTGKEEPAARAKAAEWVQGQSAEVRAETVRELFKDPDMRQTIEEEFAALKEKDNESSYDTLHYSWDEEL